MWIECTWWLQSWQNRFNHDIRLTSSSFLLFSGESNMSILDQSQSQFLMINGQIILQFLFPWIFSCIFSPQTFAMEFWSCWQTAWIPILVVHICWFLLISKISMQSASRFSSWIPASLRTNPSHWIDWTLWKSSQWLFNSVSQILKICRHIDILD